MKINANEFNKRIGERWEKGEDQNDDARSLVSILYSLDVNCTDQFELGGDGDLGEQLVDMLSELIDLGVVSISVTPPEIKY